MDKLGGTDVFATLEGIDSTRSVGLSSISTFLGHVILVLLSRLYIGHSKLFSHVNAG